MFKIADKSTETRLNWYEAKEYVKTLGNGWRLPNKEELNQIYKSDNDFADKNYWTSTEYDADYAWTQLFSHGSQNTGNKSYDCYVRAIQ